MGFNRYGYRVEAGEQIIRTNLIHSPRGGRGIGGQSRSLDQMLELAEKGKLPALKVSWSEEAQRFLILRQEQDVILEAATRCGLGSLRCIVEAPPEDLIRPEMVFKEQEDA